MMKGAVVLSLMLHRMRSAYFWFSGYVLLLIGSAQLPIHWIHPIVAGMLCVPFGFGLLMTVFGFVNVEADIASPASAYAPWILRLPVKTSTLALWPIAAAAAWASGSWLVFAQFYLKPRGMEVPLWWPAALFAALALNFQAILWVPVKRGSVRLVIAMILPMAIALFGLIADGFGWHPTQILEVYLAVAVVSAAVAWYGLIRARTSPSNGIVTTVESSTVTELARIRNTKKPFKSPQQAQFWLEWRRQGRVLPLLTAFGLLALSLPLFWSQDLHYVYSNGVIRANIWMTTGLPILPWIPLLFATAIGMGARRSDMRGSEGVYHLYHATRPLFASDMYRAKMRAIAAGVVITAIITVTTMLAWVWLPALKNDGTTIPYAQYLMGQFGVQQWSILTLIAVTLTVWTWRNQAVGAFVDYVPSKVIAMGYPFAVILSGATLNEIYTNQRDFLYEPQSVVPLSVALGIVVALKIGVAIVLAVKQVNLRPSSSRDLLNAFIKWAAMSAVAAGTFGTIVYNLDVSVVPGYMRHPACELLAIVLVPLARPIMARIALETGRHR